MRQPTIHQMRGKNHRGKVKEVERLHYLRIFFSNSYNNGTHPYTR
jgi:hypothetical protein